MERIDRVSSAGRKGLAYDWQGVLAEAAAAQLDSELATLTHHAFAVKAPRP